MSTADIEKFCNNEKEYVRYSAPTKNLTKETMINAVDDNNILMTFGSLVDPQCFSSDSGFTVGELVGLVHTYAKDKGCFDEDRVFVGFKIFSNKIDNKTVVEIMTES